MGVRKTGRRKITIDGRLLIWYVADDRDSPGQVLHVIADDKRLILRYHLDQPETPVLIVCTHMLAGLPRTDGSWRRFECPRWDSAGPITPGVVRKIVEWCLSPPDRFVERVWPELRIMHNSADAK